MKTFTSIRIFISLFAVNAGVLWGAPTAANLAGATLPAPTPYAVVSRDAHSRVWERTVYERGPSGQAIPSKHRYVELATGLNYWSNGQWQESKEEIESFPGGAIARQGQHQVIFANNLATVGAIDLQTPDGLRLRSHVLGLSYFDTASGQSVLIAEVKNSQGQLYSPNVVIYPDAFTDFKADVRYTYTLAGFEQDIILHERPPGPEAYGLNPATTRLQVLTEFLNPPQPVKQQTSVKTRQGDALDEDLDFGTMRMGRGKAFSLERSGGDIPVSKQWLKLEGRDFLVEEVTVPDLEEELQALPAAEGASLNPTAGSVRHVVSKQRRLPAMPLVQAGTNEMQLARLSLPAQGLVLDYQLLGGYRTNYTFQGDTTYSIRQVILYGTNTFEGGAVLKYASNASLSVTPFSFPMKINWQASAYRPVVFTAIDDNSVGEIINGSTGNPTNYYANPALEIAAPSIPPTISYFRIAYAKQAVYLTSGSFNFYHGQIVNCQNGFIGYGGSSANLRNVLFGNVRTNFNNLIECAFDVQNSTFSGSSYLSTIQNQPYQGVCLSLTNCLLANVTNLYNTYSYSNMGSYQINGNYNGFYQSPVFGAISFANNFYPFQSIGAGNYYLTNGCNFFNQGTTNIDPSLLSALQQKTTRPPIVYSNTTISTATTFSPQVQWDTDTPDLGYHYDPIDYVLGGVYVTNATVTINPGTVIATFGTTNNAYGLGIGSGAQLFCQGLANSLNRIVQYNTVQEQAITNWSRVSSGSIESEFLNVSPAATIFCRFTDWSMPAQDAPHLKGTNGICNPITLRDCQFHGGTLVSSYPTINLTNCLLEWVYASLRSADTNIPFLRNNLFWQGTFDFAPNVTNALVKDNLFDQTSISNNIGTYVTYNGGYNAFVTNYNRLQPAFANDVILSNSPVYQSSWLGNYYLPANSPLLDAGSTNANLVGLYHYTTQTNQVKEANSVVDIGYHYVAVDSYGNPIDTDGDGIPDYLEDSNGNGIYDVGDLGNWLISRFNGLTTANGLSVFTPLK